VRFGCQVVDVEDFALGTFDHDRDERRPDALRGGIIVGRAGRCVDRHSVVTAEAGDDETVETADVAGLVDVH
jgi:hypothetical protein